jgi:hypothetical protein
LYGNNLLRVPADVRLELERIAQRFGTSPALWAPTITQGVQLNPPSVEFARRRRTYGLRRGVRAVQLAVETVADCNGDARAQAAASASAAAQAAINYSQAFRRKSPDREAGQPLENWPGWCPIILFSACDDRLLLDSHVPADVAALPALRPEVDVQHLSAWQDAAYINATDDVLLEACWEDGRALVSKDRATLPGWLALRVADGREHAGVLFYDLERFKAHQIGALAQALASALDGTKGKLANRWITLR